MPNFKFIPVNQDEIPRRGRGPSYTTILDDFVLGEADVVRLDVDHTVTVKPISMYISLKNVAKKNGYRVTVFKRGSDIYLARA